MRNLQGNRRALLLASGIVLIACALSGLAFMLARGDAAPIEERGEELGVSLKQRTLVLRTTTSAGFAESLTLFATLTRIDDDDAALVWLRPIEPGVSELPLPDDAATSKLRLSVTASPCDRAAGQDCKLFRGGAAIGFVPLAPTENGQLVEIDASCSVVSEAPLPDCSSSRVERIVPPPQAVGLE